MTPGQKRESLSFFVLVCLMSSFYGLVSVCFVAGAIPQGLTLGYAETQGTITTSQVEARDARRSKSNGSKEDTSATYDFTVLYTYEVGGHSYTSDWMSHDAIPDDLDMARALSRRFPLNARVPVYYPADKPSRSVLLRAPEGINPFSLLVAFSLLTGMGLSWYALVWEIRRRSRGVQAVVVGGRTHVRWGLGLGGWWGLMLLCPAASAVLPSELMLSLTWAWLALFFAALLAASLLVESRRRSRIRSGVLDIVLDAPRGVLSLPLMGMVWRRMRLELPLSRIQRCHIEAEIGGRGGRRPPNWVLVFSMNEEHAPREVHAVKWRFEDRIQALWSWLKQRPELKHVLFIPR